MCKNLNIEALHTAAYSPWQNGLCERSHAVVDDCVSKILEDNLDMRLVHPYGLERGDEEFAKNVSSSKDTSMESKMSEKDITQDKMMWISSSYVFVIFGTVLSLETETQEGGKNDPALFKEAETGFAKWYRSERQRRDIHTNQDVAAQLANTFIHGVHAKRPFGPLISGKRSSLTGVRFDKLPTALPADILHENKRLFGDVFGGGYKFGNPYSPGKRALDKYDGTAILLDRRSFGQPEDLFTRQGNIGAVELGRDDVEQLYDTSEDNVFDDNFDLNHEFIQKRPFGPITGSRFRFKRTVDGDKFKSSRSLFL
ncbi:hypothetical protein ScPMuIL_006614 [Solemya velum]